MTDSTQVFHPGWRFTDSSGVPYSGAKMLFYDAGTTTPRTVYSNSGLSTSLGATVYTDSGGVPVASSGSTTEVMVYTGSTAYKIIFTTSADVEIFTLDNIRGALDTSTFLTTSSTSTLTIPVASKTGDYTILAADRGKLFNADASSATFTLTLTSAITLGDNWSVLIRNTGTANPVKIAASQAISGPWAAVGSTNSFALRPGEGAWIICNGVTFSIASMSPASLAGTVGIIEVADRVSAAPVSPTAGARYIVSGAFSTYEQEDLIEADGAGSTFEITLPTDCGWLAYVQDEDLYYQFTGSAWQKLINANTVTSTLGTYTALASTSTTFTGISASAKMVILNIAGMSLDNTHAIRLRIGPSGGVTTSGYLSANSALTNAAAVAVTNGTAGFDNSGGQASTGIYHGQIIFTLADSSTNAWVCQGALARSDVAAVFNFSGTVPLSGALERVAITTVAGTAAFDAGSASILVYV